MDLDSCQARRSAVEVHLPQVRRSGEEVRSPVPVDLAELALAEASPVPVLAAARLTGRLECSGLVSGQASARTEQPPSTELRFQSGLFAAKNLQLLRARIPQRLKPHSKLVSDRHE